MPTGETHFKVAYQVTLLHRKTKNIFVWEPASSLTPVAIKNWTERKTKFKYTAAEIEMQKYCSGSLKERIEVVSSGGIFDCGLVSASRYQSLHPDW